MSSILSGVPVHFIEDVKISDLHLHHLGGGTTEMATLNPPENETKYPEPRMFGPLPAQEFFVRHAKNIEFSNVEIASEKPDLRPVLRIKTRR